MTTYRCKSPTIEAWEVADDEPMPKWLQAMIERGDLYTYMEDDETWENCKVLYLSTALYDPNEDVSTCATPGCLVLNVGGRPHIVSECRYREFRALFEPIDDVAGLAARVDALEELAREMYLFIALNEELRGANLHSRELGSVNYEKFKGKIEELGVMQP